VDLVAAPHEHLLSAVEAIQMSGFEVVLMLDYHTTFNTDLRVSLRRAREQSHEVALFDTKPRAALQTIRPRH